MILDRFLPVRPRSKPAVIAWLGFFVLFPVAYVGGSLIEQTTLLRSLQGVSIDRGAAIAAARQFLTERGIDATSWSGYATIQPARGLIAYFRRHRDPSATAAQAFSLPLTVKVLLASDTGGYAEFFLDHAGHLVGYNLSRVKWPSEPPPAAAPEQEVIAAATAARIPNLTSVLTLGTAETKPAEQPLGPSCRMFNWHSSTNALPGLTYDINTEVCGTRPVRQTIKANLDPEYAKAHSIGQSAFLQGLIITYAIYIALVLLYAFYRYARRSFEREVSHTRTIFLGGFIAAALMLAFLTAIDEYVQGNYDGAHAVMWFPLIIIAVAFGIFGWVIAVTYEAGEGDLRELYPERLTSLDAILRGKVFSRNVARSVLFGAAWAGWMVLGQGILNLVLHPEAGATTAEVLKVPFFRVPIVALLMGEALSVTLIPASALLLPLGFLHRNLRRVHLRNALLLICAILGSLIFSNRYGSAASAISGVSVLAATVIVPFLAMDFLAVMFGIGAFQVAIMLARLSALSASSSMLGIGVGAIGLAFLAIEAWAAVRGREYSDSEVRPVYARHIAERQLLVAEMAAAREAQLQLLPRMVPEVSGLSISAACIPASIVGGDFYDFFPLGDGKLGIFIAEGGNRGVGSALTIALAKGFLMHAVRRSLAPHEVVTRLERALGTYLEGTVASTHVAYAVIDTVVGQVRYARTGEYPKVLVSSIAKERHIEIPESDKIVYEGTARLRGGDTILLFTDGIARTLSINGSRAVDDVLRLLARKRRDTGLPDDLTAVVVRVTRTGAAMEVVA